MLHGPVSAALLALALAACGGDAVEQPIAFNHKLHLENDMKCADCHQHFESAPFSGLPGKEICVECHETALGKSAEEEKVRDYHKRGEEIPWERVYLLPEHVYYSHQRHVVVAGLECKTCHGDIGKLTSPPEEPLVEHTMDWCLECHQARGATQDCIHCHR